MVKSFLFVGLTVLLTNQVKAQSIPSLPSPTQAAKGQTQSMTVQSGSKASLSFGTSTTFGAAGNLQVTEGTKGGITSYMAPSSGSVTSSIGKTDTTNGITSAKISNLRASGTGPTSIGGSNINATDANFSSGDAVLSGVIGGIDIKIDPNKTQFTVDLGTVHDKDGKNIISGNQVSSGSAQSSVGTNTNVEINSTNFTSTFSQTF
jgi:hypothetical protein